MRILIAVLSLMLAQVAVAADSQSSGTLEVRGEAGPTQYFSRVKAQRCSRPILTVNKSNKKSLKRNCDQPVYFDLNQKQILPAGTYIVGFENTLYPGPVTINTGADTTINLVKIGIPDTFPKEKNVKVFRDFSTLTEQRKIYFEMYYSGKHFFKLTSRYSFGDYYLTDGQRPDNIQWRSLDLCSTIRSFKAAREHAKFICQTWNTAASMTDLADIFKFETATEVEGQFQEAWVSEPGDIQPIRHQKHLVAAPVSVGSFVSVMPGIYRLIAEGKGAKSIRTQTPELQETYLPEDLMRELAIENSIIAEKNTNESLYGSSISDAELEELDPATDCSTASVWRTEFRSYCATDKAEGCDRNIVKKCEPMRIDLRFRKY